jgi:HlyB family type I secretion system ABC transporter
MERTATADAPSRQSLRHCELLQQLSDQELSELWDKSEKLSCPLGKIIPKEEQAKLYFVLSGRIRLIAASTSGANSESTLCTLSGPIDYWKDSWSAGTDKQLKVRASADSILLRPGDAVIANLIANNKPFENSVLQADSQWRAFVALRALEHWSKIPSEQIRTLVRQSEQFERGASTPEECPEGLYFVVDGSVKVTEAGGAVRNLQIGDLFCKGVALLSINGATSGISGAGRLLRVAPEHIADFRLGCPDLIAALATGTSGHAAPGGAADMTSAVKSVVQITPQESKPEELEESATVKFRRMTHQYPILLQQSQMDCGITCIAMVALFFGKKLDINDLRERAGVGIEGTSLLSLAETAEHMGFMTRGLRGTFEGLLNAHLPVICFWRNNHFVVLYEIHESYAVIGDPAEGLLKITREEFNKDFSKSILEMVPTVELKRAPGVKNPLTIIMPLLKPYMSQVRDVLIAGVVFQVLMIVTPFFTQTIVDRVIVHEDISMLNMLLVGMILVTVFQSAITFTRGILISTLSTKIDHMLFVQFFKHLFSLPLKFFEERTTGDILTRFNQNSRITAFLSGGTVTTLLDGAMTVIYLGILFWYNVYFGLATVVYIALLVAATSAYTPLLRGYSNELFKKTVASDSCVIESVHGVEKIKSAAAENRIRWKWEVLFVDKLSTSFKQQLALNGYSVVTQLVHLSGRILLMWLGAHLVIAKQFTVGQYMAANMMSGMVIDPLMRVISMWNQLQGVNISVDRLGDVFRSNPEQVGVRARLPEIEGNIEFRNVTFRYNERATKNTLLNVSFAVRPNQMIALVGRSGCGKTTIARLIQGLYVPVSGSVLVDGIDTAQADLSDLRKRIGVVAQQEFFFTATVRENLAFYCPDAELEKIIEAAKIAGIHEKIKTLGSGYDTLLSEGGQNLSGGERQRLAIARALLHNPKILILDEATSALDSESERQIQACMETVRKGRTIFVIAHRLSTIKTADLIMVMDQGQVVEAGNHAALLEKKGLYFHLCSQQSI